jgi:hypothetical protein
MRLRIPFISTIAAAALTLGGCAYGDVGYGGLGVGLAYGNGYYGNGYYGAGYGPYGGYGAYPGYYGDQSAYYGWYDNYYYPGTGSYVYDSYRRPHTWSDRQRTYWSTRRQSATSSGISTSTNWSAWQHNQSEAQRVNWHRVRNR